MKIYFTWIAAAVFFSLMLVPASSYARVNTLIGGLSASYDYNDRSYSAASDDPATEVNEAELNGDRDDDYESIVFTPLIHFKSLSERDSFELRAAPGIKYDLIDEESDWDNNLYVAADRFLTKSWQLRASNQFLRSDYHNTDTQLSTDPVDPQLSTDLGRRRYWRNTFNIYSDHHYYEDSLFQMGFGYTALRNDDTGVGGYEDSDRYTVSLRNDHRYSSIWQSTVDLQFVQGDFDPADRETVETIIDELAPDSGFTPTDDQLSNDLNEYHLLLTLNNESIAHNPLSVTYNFIRSKYDEVLRDDSDIHQMRFNWKREITPQIYTNLGIGPSYEKTEGRDANWAGNGIAELNYQIERGSFNLSVEKKYDVDNFSGTDERGPVDIWDSRASFNYLLQKDLSLTSYLSYVYEDREDQVVVLDEGLLVTQLEEYQKDRYIAGVGLNYSFLQYYSAGVNYTFTKQESDRIGDDYDDHRLLFTLSWQKELSRW